MSYFSTSTHTPLFSARRAALHTAYAGTASDVENLHTAQLLDVVSPRENTVIPVNPSPKLKLLAIASAIVVVHLGIWYVVEHLSPPALELAKQKPVVVELIKPPVEKPKPPEPPKVIQPKIPPIVQKPKPVVQQPVKQVQPKPQPVIKLAPAPEPVVEPVHEVVKEAVPVPEPVKQAPPAPPAPAPVKQEPITEAKGYAGYLNNPAPEYPEVALDRGWQGQVILRIKVQPSGKPSTIQVKKSSGYKALDDAASRTVKRWTFSPALQGSTPIEGWVDVPLEFRLPS